MILIRIFIIGFVLVLGLTLLRKPWQRKTSYPPGPRGLPIIGNMLTMNPEKLTHHGLARLAKDYGGILHVRIGFKHIVAVSSPEIARQILQVHDKIFSNRIITKAMKYLTYDQADIAFANYGPLWREMRKLCVIKLFSRRRAESWQSVRDEVDSLIRVISASTGSTVNIGELIFTLTRNIIYRAAFGTSFMEGKDKFLGIVREFSTLFGEFQMSDFIPFLTWGDHQGLNAPLVKARESLDKYIDDVIEKHMQKRETNGYGRGDDDEADTDMVDELLRLYVDERGFESADSKNSIRFTKENIKAVVMDAMFGGTETVASAAEWALAELLRSPAELKKVQQELADVVGLNREVRESDIEKLVYLKRAIKETLRLHPPITLLLHGAAEDATISGYRIPANSMVLVNAWAIGRDPAYWEDPETFKPSRFLEPDAVNFKGGSFVCIPFGSGRRSCPGMQLALYTSELAMAQLLHCYKWELPDGMKASEMDMTDQHRLTTTLAHRLIAVPSSRLVNA